MSRKKPLRYVLHEDLKLNQLVLPCGYRSWGTFTGVSDTFPWRPIKALASSRLRWQKPQSFKPYCLSDTLHRDSTYVPRKYSIIWAVCIKAYVSNICVAMRKIILVNEGNIRSLKISPIQNTRMNQFFEWACYFMNVGEHHVVVNHGKQFRRQLGLQLVLIVHWQPLGRSPVIQCNGHWQHVPRASRRRSDGAI